MKAYKKYGDIYHVTKQVRDCMANGYHGDVEGLRDFWCEKIQELLNGDVYKNWDCIAGYCEMFHLSYVIEKKDILHNWKRAVLAHRQSYKYNKP